MMMKITAENFWRAFRAALLTAEPQGYGELWTTGMYKTLHNVQATFGLWCQCLHHGEAAGSPGERLKVDLLWFPQNIPALSETEQEWVAPAVAIEHENGYDGRDRAVDHWKVSQVAAPLRVFIGYTRHAAQINDAATLLQRREARWNAVPDGETLIVLGHSGLQYDCFRAWSAPQGRDSWQLLSAPSCACEGGAG